MKNIAIDKTEIDGIKHLALAHMLKETKESLAYVGEKYCSTDNGFFADFNKGLPNSHEHLYRWMNGIYKIFSQETLEFSNLKPYRVHRFITVPYPEYIENSDRRLFYINAIKSTVHYHLWNGAVCYVVFMNPNEYKSSKLSKDDVVSIVDKVTFNFKNLYTDKFINYEKLEKEVGKDFFKQHFEMIKLNDLKNSIQLFYDGFTYENKRRKNDVANKNMKKFIYHLYGGICQQTFCSNKGKKLTIEESEIDHIIPIAQSNNEIPNLQLYCKECNKHKGGFYSGREPFNELYGLIYKPYRSEDIREKFLGVPASWIDRISQNKSIDIRTKI